MHLPLALLTGIGVLVSGLVEPTRFPIRICTFRAWTDHPCPFCGYTRAFHAIATGQVATAVQNCPAALLAYLLMVLVFSWHAAAILCQARLRRGRLLQVSRWPMRVALWIGLLMVTANWIYRLSVGIDCP